MLITIKEYVKPESIDKAYDCLVSKKNSVLIGGGAFVRMGRKNITTAIDLSEANLNTIKETEDEIEIGGMTTFGELEQSPILKKYFSNMLALSVKDIVGVQLRNIVTVGGTVHSRYGFSDLITALLALDTMVKLYKQGIIPLEEFLAKGSEQPDILESIIIKKDSRKAAFESMRNSKGDYAILNVAISKLEDRFRISVGARPSRATLAYDTMDYLNKNGYSHKNIIEASKMASDEITFGTNSRGGKEYRREICKVLLKRALLEVVGNAD
ncbi:FAD binding domain-containing protein [Wukongibacter baidiensis]|uniref:FAD binding domain-containing protein n=1 Tax=Wukongibacter baidiensis TaxID=1723361 RepID=UPI003D7F242A